MENHVDETPAKPVKRACTECRQQKAKCDAHLRPDQPCTRCQKLNLACLISNSFKRLHKRERLSELEQEAEALRKRLRTSNSAETQSPHPHYVFPTPVVLPQLPAVSAQPLASSYSPQVNNTLLSASEVDSVASLNANDPTIARELDGVPITAQDIDDLFHIYFREYFMCMPVLDAKTSPNAYYAQSTFLFWTIIGVASRSFPQRSRLYTDLSQSIINLAFLSINSAPRPIYSIQGLLLILTWPMAREHSRMDVTYPLAGLLIHRAKQIGLHHPQASHEFYFSRERQKRLSEAECAARSDLWALSILVYQRVCTSKGHLPNRMYDMAPDYGSPRLSTAMRLQLRCQEVVTRCNVAVVEIGLHDLSTEQKRALDIVLRAYQDQIQSIENDALAGSQLFPSNSTLTSGMPTMSKFDICACKLSMQCFYMYMESTITFDSPLAKLLATACTAIDLIQELRQMPNFAPIPPYYVLYTLFLASFSLLRILKTPASPHVDNERATTHLALGINLARETSTYANDLCAKAALVLTQLWNNPKAFRRADGTEDMAVRVRNRLALGPMLDVMWRWYDIVDEQQPKLSLPFDGIRDSTTSRTKAAATHTNILDSAAPSTSGEPFQCDFFDDQIFADFDWTLGDEFLSL